MLKVSLNRTKLTTLINNAKRLRSDVSRARDRGNVRAAEEIKSLIQFEVPVVTGNLRGSISVEQLGISSFVIGHDKDKTKTSDGKHSYGDIVYYGIRKGYWIFPKRAKVLRFEVNGKVVYTKRAFIPPRPGNLFVDRALGNAVSKRVGEKAYRQEFAKITLLR